MTAKSLRILIIGGYGVFGGRLVRLLSDQADLTILVGGRSLDKAEKFCKAIAAKAELVPTFVDRESLDVESLRKLAPDLVIDASGPFQLYDQKSQPYRVVQAVVACGVPYLDLADGTDFVMGISRFDAEARAQGIFVLAGASSCPALSGAVVRHLAGEFDHIDSVVGGISPSPYAGVGLNVVRAITAYGGKPVALNRDGQHATGTALAETMRFTIAPPGKQPLNNRLFSLVDVPDLKLLPSATPGLRSAWFGAGPVPEIWHRGLTMLARLVHWRLLPSLTTLARPAHWIINTLRWGEVRGGMFVAVHGVCVGGSAATHSWHLVAEGDDGPFIPAMACAAIVHRMLDGRSPVPGARPANDAVELPEFERLFSRYAIATGVRKNDSSGSDQPLYARILGSAWDDLPAPIRAIHSADQTLTARGRASIERGTNPMAQLVAAVVGFPKAAPDVPVEVRFDVENGREIWTRTFDGRDFRSVQSAGLGRSEHLIDERFGPVTIGLAVVVENERLRLIPRRWSVLGIPIPRTLLAYGDTYEHASDGRFHFHVEICLPVIGLIVRYRGHLTPVAL